MAGSGAPRRMWVLMATVFVDMVGVLMVLPLLPYYATRFEATGWTIGLLTSVFAAAQLCAAPVWGRLSDRYGRRPVILCGLFPTSTSILSQRSPQEELGQMLGVQQSFRGIAGILGPAWAGVAYDYLGAFLGLGAPFFISAVLMSVAVVFTARVAAQRPSKAVND